MTLSNIAIFHGGGAQKSYPEHIGTRVIAFCLVALLLGNFFNLKVDHILLKLLGLNHSFLGCDLSMLIGNVVCREDG